MSARYLPWAVLFICVALAWPVQAQTGGGYDLTWSTIDSGSGTSSGGGYSLSGTAGQPDAGTMTGGRYTLVGGFWGGGISGTRSRYVYLPIVLR